MNFSKFGNVCVSVSTWWQLGDIHELNHLTRIAGTIEKIEQTFSYKISIQTSKLWMRPKNEADECARLA